MVIFKARNQEQSNLGSSTLNDSAKDDSDIKRGSIRIGFMAVSILEALTASNPSRKELKPQDPFSN